MDPRLHISNKRVTGVNYKTNPKLSCVVTTGDGHIAVGSDTGEIRLYSDVDKRAKTALPGLGHGVTSVDVTEDGHWILATTDRYLILAETVLENGRTGFQTRMGQHKPIPYKLQLKIEDMVKFGITDLKFTAAKFDTGENIEESWIITSTGPFIITWNFAKIKRNGRIDDYQIKRCEEEVVADQFRYNLADQVVVTMLDDITVRNRRPIHRRGH